MVALASVIFVEEIWRRGAGFSVAVGIVLLAAATITIFSPALLPGGLSPLRPCE